MSDVFILGTGFSKAISPVMPVLTELSEQVRERCKIVDDALFADNIEMWLTFLSQSHPWLSEADNLRNRAKFLDISQAVRLILVESTGTVVREKGPHWLSNLKSWWDTQRAVVLTLNYDTLVERGIPPGPEKSSLRSDDGWEPLYPIEFVPAPTPWRAVPIGVGRQILQARFRLFKLHGSINWFYSGTNPSYGETIYFVPPYEWGNESSASSATETSWSDWERAQSEWASTKAPLIVPPVAEKLPYFQHEAIRRVWADAGQALKSAQRIFSLGYSLPETDITMRFLLHSSHPTERVKFYVVNRNPNVAGRCRALLPGDYYDVDDRFVRLDPIPRLVEALPSLCVAQAVDR